MFAQHLQNQDPVHLQSHNSGLNGMVNGSIGSASPGNSVMNTNSFLVKESKKMTKVSCSRRQEHSQDMDQMDNRTIVKTIEKKSRKQTLETFALSGSHAGTSSESSSDGEQSSSDPDDTEEEEEDHDEVGQSNDSEESDSPVKAQVKKSVKRLTQNTSDWKKKRSCTADAKAAQGSHYVLPQEHHHSVPGTSSYFKQTLSNPVGQSDSSVVYRQNLRMTEERQQHISVIQTTGFAATNCSLTQSNMEGSSLASNTPPSLFSVSSPKHFPLSTHKHMPPSTSSKLFCHSSSPKDSSASNSPKPLSLCFSSKSSTLMSRPPLSSTAFPIAPTFLASQNPPQTTKCVVASVTQHVDSVKINSNETSLHENTYKLKQDFFKQSFTLPPKTQDSNKNGKVIVSSSSVITAKPSPDTISRQIKCVPHSSGIRLSRSHHLNGMTPSAVQDAPLALIMKTHSHNRVDNKKPPLLATSSPSPMPVNLSIGTRESPGSCVTSQKPSGPSGVMITEIPKSLHAGKSLNKTISPCPLVDQGIKSDIHTSKDSDNSLGDDENDVEDEDSGSSLSESDSNLESDSDGSEGHLKARGETEADDASRGRARLGKVFLFPHRSFMGLSTNSSALDLQFIKSHSLPILATPNPKTGFRLLSNHSTSSPSYTFSKMPGSVARRRITDERVLQLPLAFGWKRETRISTVASRRQGEVVYFAPCGKKLRQYPDVIKYLLRNGITEISRDNFSFSTKIKVGDFYEAKEGPEGLQWFLLSEEEIAPSIVALDGRRIRRTKTEQKLTVDEADDGQLKGHSAAVGESNLQVVSNAKLQQKLETKDTAQRAAQVQMMRKLEKQALVQAVKEAKRQQAIMIAEEKRKKKEQMKILKQQEKIKRIQQVRMEKELRAQQILEVKRRKKEAAANAKILETEKRNKEKEMRRMQAVVLKHQELERHRLDMGQERRRQHMMLMKAIEARKKAENKAHLKQEKKDEKRLNKERKLEIRRLELEKAKELKKPNEDMCLADHKPLPQLSPLPGLVLSGKTFSDCLMVLQFLHRFGEVLGLDIRAKVPSLHELQAGLLNTGDNMGKVQDLLVSMLSAAVCDPGVAPGHKSKTALGDHLTSVKINRDNVSEILQIYMEGHCQHTELAELALSVQTKAFQAHIPSQKATILAFLVNELCCSKVVISEIDKTIDHMTSLRKDKWVIEGKLRKLKSIHADKTGKRETSVGGEERQNFAVPLARQKCKRKDGDSEEEEDEDVDSEDQADDDDDVQEMKGKKVHTCEEEDDSDHTASVEELEKQMEKTYKQQSLIRQKLFDSSHSLRSMMIGQDRYRRRYWVLPQCGGIFVEGMENSEGYEEELKKEMKGTNHVVKVKEEELEEMKNTEQPEKMKEIVVSRPAWITEQGGAKPQDQHNNNLFSFFLQKPDCFSKLGKLFEVAKETPEAATSPQKSQNTEAMKLSTAVSHPLYPTSKSGLSCSVPSDASHMKLREKTNTFLPHLQSANKHRNIPWMTCSSQSILPDQLPKTLAGKSSPWFSLLPRSPCDDSSVTRGSILQTPSSSPEDPIATANCSILAGTNTMQLSVHNVHEKPGIHQSRLPLCGMPRAVMSSTPTFPSSYLPPMLDLAYHHAEGHGDKPFLANNNFLSESEISKPLSVEPSYASFPALEGSKTQDYPHPQPVPEAMVRGWWRVSDMDELHSLMEALHTRGIRERVLQKQFQKHMEYVTQFCSNSKDAVIDAEELEKQEVSEETVKSWCVEEQAMEVDLSLLQQVEVLERKVISASLQVKGWMHPDPESHREDLVYHEHKPFCCLAVNKTRWRDVIQLECRGSVVRRPNNPLDIAVTRLAELERNIKQSSEEESSPGMRLWRKALSEVRSSAQLSLCLQHLQKSIAWEQAVVKEHCQLCHREDNEDLLLLCDACDKGCHTYCHNPKITTVPQDGWFCPSCLAKENSHSRSQQSRTARGLKKGSEVKGHSKTLVAAELLNNEIISTPNICNVSKKGTKEFRKRKGEDSPPRTRNDSATCYAKKGRIDKDDVSNQLAMCWDLLAELEVHQDSWPFLMPVNHKTVPRYRKVIKKPMDFSTIRDKLHNNQYLTVETFIGDVNLVFDNCKKFNKDASEIGQAGHRMRRFFIKRWTEVLKQK
ncbi:bromodomain adjacent to zinc finger domain protein 2B [Thalassophryne amazonica]|uniref:bromodomain adjacent to zinc finger domain protein 2B n=1 Tax=Thalassophryne amazonica TaxID=390379 RepID=UPI0014708B94|nr:bromodomain adjacent to zinc finger domain protein 2B [Thalassophryne amazonica]